MRFLTIKNCFFPRKIDRFCIKKRDIKVQNFEKNKIYSAIQEQLNLYPSVDMNCLLYGLQDFSNAMDSLLPNKKFKMVRKLQRLYQKQAKVVLLAQMAKYFDTFDKESILGIFSFSAYSENVSETLIRFYLYKIYFLNKRKEGLMFLQEFLQSLVNLNLKRKLMGVSAINIAKLEVQYLYKDTEIPFALMFAKKSFSINIYTTVRIYILKISCIQGNIQKAMHILGELVKNGQIPPFSIINLVLKTVLCKSTFVENTKRESYLLFFYNKIFSNSLPNSETIKILANYSLTYNEFDKLWNLVIKHPYKNEIIKKCQSEIARAFLRIGRKYWSLSNYSINLSANVMNFFQYLEENVTKLHKNTIIYLTLCCSLFDNFIGLKHCFEALNAHQWKLSKKHYATIYRQTFDLNSKKLKTCRHDFIKYLWKQSEQENLVFSSNDSNEHSLVEYVRCMGSFYDIQEILCLIKRKKMESIKKGTLIGFIEAFNVANAHTESLLLLKSLLDSGRNIDLNILKCLFNNIQTISAWNDILSIVSIELVRNRIIISLDFFVNILEKIIDQNYVKKSVILKKDHVNIMKRLIKEYAIQLNKITKELQDQKDIEIALIKFENIDYSGVTFLY
ncbi:hypothetical protein PORY_001952 [Pneumocystis oryctolagi]|uniref:Uncharacterized protein n=1 Tax=Pneumocystis oryctolagi TaxID=42067 RepID=A0ACB7CCI0_9ASCO|nr:hypothetical protein PORY_001952 [Pneumocystis oryctolagi]